jgi:anti-sigma factor (TIGR02949 family)
LRLLYVVVDNEASEKEKSKVQDHIKNCHKCSQRYELEVKFKDCVEKKGKFSPECDDLRSKIEQQLDNIDIGGGEADLFPTPFD